MFPACESFSNVLWEIEYDKHMTDLLFIMENYLNTHMDLFIYLGVRYSYANLLYEH